MLSGLPWPISSDIVKAEAPILAPLVATHPTVASYRETIRQLDLDVGARKIFFSNTNN